MISEDRHLVASLEIFLLIPKCYRYWKVHLWSGGRKFIYPVKMAYIKGLSWICVHKRKLQAKVLVSELTPLLQSWAHMAKRAVNPSLIWSATSLPTHMAISPLLDSNRRKKHRHRRICVWSLLPEQQNGRITPGITQERPRCKTRYKQYEAQRTARKHPLNRRGVK